ncbi:integrase catalytic domain-containing protein [Acinetobacter baumannii]|uniref:integrase catalytic domain-containing protein n=1 Tax=Acinetobacter baumannii TaxID=470 RepID=UPI0033968E37
MSTDAWQRVHADYCGPFLSKYYALIIVDSYSKWPEVIFTTSFTAEFTTQALRKVYILEGVPSVLVTDNGTHFAASCVTELLKSVGCRHPCSNGQA